MPDKVFYHRHRLAAAPGLDPKNIHPPAMFPRRSHCARICSSHHRSFGRGRRQSVDRAAKGVCIRPGPPLVGMRLLSAIIHPVHSSPMNQSSTRLRAHGVLRRNVRLDLTVGLN